MGDKKILIPNKVINVLKGWNQNESSSGPDYDKRVTVALLLVCVDTADLVNHKVNDDVKKFIAGKHLFFTVQLAYNTNTNIEFFSGVQEFNFLVPLHINGFCVKIYVEILYYK